MPDLPRTWYTKLWSRSRVRTGRQQRGPNSGQFPPKFQTSRPAPARRVCPAEVPSYSL